MVGITKGSWSIDLSQGTELGFCKTDYLETGRGRKHPLLGRFIPHHTDTATETWIRISQKLSYFCEQTNFCIFSLRETFHVVYTVHTLSLIEYIQNIHLLTFTVKNLIVAIKKLYSKKLKRQKSDLQLSTLCKDDDDIEFYNWNNILYISPPPFLVFCLFLNLWDNGRSVYLLFAR